MMEIMVIGGIQVDIKVDIQNMNNILILGMEMVPDIRIVIKNREAIVNLGIPWKIDITKIEKALPFQEATAGIPE